MERRRLACQVTAPPVLLRVFAVLGGRSAAGPFQRHARLGLKAAVQAPLNRRKQLSHIRVAVPPLRGGSESWSETHNPATAKAPPTRSQKSRSDRVPSSHGPPARLLRVVGPSRWWLKRPRPTSKICISRGPRPRARSVTNRGLDHGVPRVLGSHSGYGPPRPLLPGRGSFGWWLNPLPGTPLRQTFQVSRKPFPPLMIEVHSTSMMLSQA